MSVGARLMHLFSAAAHPPTWNQINTRFKERVSVQTCASIQHIVIYSRRTVEEKR